MSSLKKVELSLVALDAFFPAPCVPSVHSVPEQHYVKGTSRRPPAWTPDHVVVN